MKTTFKAKGHITKYLSIFTILIFTIFSTINAFPTYDVVIKSSGIITTLSPLHVEGNCIKNLRNQTVTLRGVNQAGFADHPNGWWNPEGGSIYSGLGVWNPDAVKYNLDKMKQWGCNVVRLHTVIQWWLENTNNYRQHIKDTIAWAGERGIYVIFEPTFVRGGEYACFFELPYYPYLVDDTNSSNNNREGDVAVMPNRTAFINYWVSVVNELEVYPNVLFEVFNEPHGNATVADEFFEMVQEWINVTRNAGATQLLVVQWGIGTWVNFGNPPPDPHEPPSDAHPCLTFYWVEYYPLYDPLGNLVYSTHKYRWDFHRWFEEEQKMNGVWTYDEIKQGYNITLLNYVLFNLSKPVIIGEIGADMWQTGTELERELAWFNNSLTILNEWGVSYIAWVWTATAHMRHGLLQNAVWLPPPTQSGEILISKISEASRSVP